ncbi:hypothetical protein PIB30_071411 [Stylosanthes scabra]|uniref:DUF4283 domain-containing protein n=1 Tax=Stylosanthes scabra TaxID=79078 RepID=A0ABU6YPJ1_9FABA|nr:hypothetical protein [Stylosanthes scabra]
MDVFVSRKARWKMMSLFAFIRYNSYGSAMRAIARLNGTLWGKFKLFVTLSKIRREMKQPRVMHTDPKQRWVEKSNEQEMKNLKMVADQKKEIEATWAEDQKQRLQRSLLGVCVKPIEFKKVMERLMEEWKGPDEIECRDIGPYKCLITFDSLEIRDEAFHSELLLATFDEIRPHLEIFWSLSRRVWIEIMGMPVCMWCEENFSKIAKQRGKVIRFDDRTEQSKSYSVARVLVDSYQWERIHKWITIKVEDRSFEVFVKEFGSEVYSVQSHPDLVQDTDVSDFMEVPNSASRVEETPVEIEQTSATVLRKDLNDVNVGNSHFDANIDCELNTVCKLKQLGGIGGVEEDETDAKVGPSTSMCDDSLGSCPYPPGFGPCSGHGHVHHDLIRVQNLPHFVVPHSVEVVRAVEFPYANPSLPIAAVECHSGTLSDEERSGETLYRINDSVWFGVNNDIAKLVGGVGGAAKRRLCRVVIATYKCRERKHYISQTTSLRLSVKYGGPSVVLEVALFRWVMKTVMLMVCYLKVVMVMEGLRGASMLALGLSIP